MDRPSDLFDREQEWQDLVGFVRGGDEGPRLGLVYGRRRQGKSHLLRALARQADGLYHQALEEERLPALTRIGALVTADAGLGSGDLRLADWPAALRALIERAGTTRPIIIDEFPFLLGESPELASAIQAAFDEARLGHGPSFRLLLCGSAMSVMSELLSGQKALRGRAVLELVVHTFDFRQAAAFWSIRDPGTAFLVHAIVGGTPGYRSLLGGPAPVRPEDLLDWLAAGVLNPSHAMFREAEYLLTEDPGITDRALYQSVLGAIAEGRSTRSAVGAALGKQDSALRHPLLVLERAGLIRRDHDLWRANRPLLRIDDPFLRFHFAVLRPGLAGFEAREIAASWARAAPTFASRVLGPHFEQLARSWTARFASERTLGGRPAAVGWTQLNDAQARTKLEVDVVALGERRTSGRLIVLAVGEAKGGTTEVSEDDLARLEQARRSLADRGDVSATKLLLFSRSGFTRGLLAVSRARGDVELVDLDRLYGGD